MEFGLCSFGETTPLPGTGVRPPSDVRLRDLIAEIALADKLGLDVFAVGEHHREDFAVSAPAVVLGAAAAVTERIRLSSGVTVLSSDDPVRVYQQFATVDLLSGGRAEIMAGRGSFIESFPLFGYDLQDYERLFEERLDLLLRVREQAVVSWPGGLQRPALDRRVVHPRALQDPLPVRIGVGGTPASAVRAGTLGLPMAVAIIGGMPERFTPFMDLYREAGQRAGHAPGRLRVAVNTLGFIAEDGRQAAERMFPAWAEVMTRIGRERGWPPVDRAQFDAACSPRGALVVGSPKQVADKLIQHHRWFGHQRTLLQLSVGSLPHGELMRSIELYATEVVPRVRRALGEDA